MRLSSSEPACAPSVIARTAQPHVAVVGAGVTGVTTAWALLNRGCAVTMIDRARYPAMETSFANGGQLSASNAEVWNSVANVLKGLRWMLSADAPLLMNPSPSWRKYRWIAEFLGGIRSYRASTEETVRLAIAARAPLLAFAEQAGVDFDLERRGILHLFSSEKAFAHGRRVSEILTGAGLYRRTVSAEEACAIEPALSAARGRLVGGCYTPSDFSGDAHKYASGLAAAAARRGAVLRMETEIVGARAEPGSGVSLDLAGPNGQAETLAADAVIVAAGVGSPAIGRLFGDRVPVYPVKGYSITVALEDAASRAAAPRVSLLDDAAKIVASRLGDDRFRIAGTAEFAGENRDIRAARIRPLMDWCARWFPSVSTEYAQPWAGLRPMTPTMLPKVGVGRRPGVFYNTGHGHLGWTLSAATAEIIADRVADHLADRLADHSFEQAAAEPSSRPSGGRATEPVTA